MVAAGELSGVRCYLPRLAPDIKTELLTITPGDNPFGYLWGRCAGHTVLFQKLDLRVGVTYPGR